MASKTQITNMKRLLQHRHTSELGSHANTYTWRLVGNWFCGCGADYLFEKEKWLIFSRQTDQWPFLDRNTFNSLEWKETWQRFCAVISASTETEKDKHCDLIEIVLCVSMMCLLCFVNCTKTKRRLEWFSREIALEIWPISYHRIGACKKNLWSVESELPGFRYSFTTLAFESCKKIGFFAAQVRVYARLRVCVRATEGQVHMLNRTEYLASYKFRHQY